MIPESQKENNDLVDLLTTSFQKVIDLDGPSGKMEKQLIIDPKTAFYQLHSVSSNTFGRFVYELEQFDAKANQAKKHMSPERAESMAEDIRAITDAYRYSIDAKSSESLSDKNNAIPTLIDKIKSNKVERRYVMKDEVKKSILDGIRGKDVERDQSQD